MASEIHILDQGIQTSTVTWRAKDLLEPLVLRARRLTGDIFDFFSVDYYNNKRMHTHVKLTGVTATYQNKF